MQCIFAPRNNHEQCFEKQLVLVIQWLSILFSHVVSYMFIVFVLVFLWIMLSIIKFFFIVNCRCK